MGNRLFGFRRGGGFLDIRLRGLLLSGGCHDCLFGGWAGCARIRPRNCLTHPHPDRCRSRRKNGERTRPRVLCPAPSPGSLGSTRADSPQGVCKSAERFRRGAGNSTRGRVRSPFPTASLRLRLTRQCSRISKKACPACGAVGTPRRRRPRGEVSRSGNRSAFTSLALARTARRAVPTAATPFFISINS